jgi:hypothetical protein
VPNLTAALIVGGVIAAVLIVAGLLISFALPRGVASYIGCNGGKSQRRSATGTPVEVVVFDECEGATFSITAVHENGTYRYTRFWYKLARRGRKPMRITGSYHREAETSGSPSHFGRGLLAAWTEHRWARVDTQLRAGTSVAFRAGAFELDVQPGVLRVRAGKRVRQIGGSEIADVLLAQGWLVIRKHAAKSYEPSLMFSRKPGWVKGGSAWQIDAAKVVDLPVLLRALQAHVGLAIRP